MFDKAPGFSLMEMALVLIIIGLIGGVTLPTLKIMLEGQRARTTAQHQDQILYALASFANQNKFLPHAADPTASQGRQDTATKRRRGIVPFADLGLPESIAKDGYLNWFTYVVDDYYTVPSERSVAEAISQPSISKLCMTHTYLTALRIRGLQDNVALALISHGPKGRGAYPDPLVNPPLGAEEQQNTTSDREIIDRPISYDPSHPFSHKVVWATSRNLLAIYGHAPCPPTQEALAQSGETRYDPAQNSD